MSENVEKVEKYGTYKTNVTTIKNSALAQWSGYGYQGHCAIHHALRLLNSDKEKAKNYLLALESYEDFAIMSDDERIVSLHQCKCYSNSTDFTDECKKISDKREYYCNELNVADLNVPSFFHSNVTLAKALVCNVKTYEFDTGKTTCGADEIFELIQNEAAKYMTANNCSGSDNIKAHALVHLVNAKVAVLHSMKSTTDFWTVATTKSNWIPFSKIIDVLEGNDDLIQSETLRAITARNTINLYMGICLSDDMDEPNFATKERIVNRFLNAFNSLDGADLVEVVRRLNPHVEWNEECADDMKAPEKGKSLYTLLTSVNKEMSDYGNFQWNECGVLESPSTIMNDRSVVKKALEIRKCTSQSFLMDYRWVVGNITESLPNIYDLAVKVTDGGTDDKMYDRITHPAKLGLLSIDDKNDGNYEKNNP